MLKKNLDILPSSSETYNRQTPVRAESNLEHYISNNPGAILKRDFVLLEGKPEESPINLLSPEDKITNSQHLDVADSQPGDLWDALLVHVV